MSFINDTEDLFKAIQTHVKANLNTKITAINSEKNDDITLDIIKADDTHYVFAGELLECPNNAFVNFALDGPVTAKVNGGNISLIPSFVIEVAFDNPKKPNTYWKSMRYMRAIYECMLEFEPAANEVTGLEIEQLEPMIIAHIKRELVVSGIKVSMAIG